jgi:hypothetical protein
VIDGFPDYPRISVEAGFVYYNGERVAWIVKKALPTVVALFSEWITTDLGHEIAELEARGRLPDVEMVEGDLWAP